MSIKLCVSKKKGHSPSGSNSHQRRGTPTPQRTAVIADRQCAEPRPGSSGAGWRRMSTVGSAPRGARPLQRNLSAPPAVRTRQHRAGAPRTRCYRPAVVLGSYVHRAPGSTGSSLSASCSACPPAGSARSCRPRSGARSPPPTVISRVVGTLDAAVAAAFQGRRLDNRYKALMRDDVVPTR